MAVAISATTELIMQFLLTEWRTDRASV